MQNLAESCRICQNLAESLRIFQKKNEYLSHGKEHLRDVAVAHLLSVGPIFKGSDVAQVRVTVGTERFSFSKRSYTSASYKKLWYYDPNITHLLVESRPL